MNDTFELDSSLRALRGEVKETREALAVLSGVLPPSSTSYTVRGELHDWRSERAELTRRCAALEQALGEREARLDVMRKEADARLEAGDELLTIQAESAAASIRATEEAAGRALREIEARLLHARAEAQHADSLAAEARLATEARLVEQAEGHAAAMRLHDRRIVTAEARAETMSAENELLRSRVAELSVHAGATSLLNDLRASLGNIEVSDVQAVVVRLQTSALIWARHYAYTILTSYAVAASVNSLEAFVQNVCDVVFRGRGSAFSGELKTARQVPIVLTRWLDELSSAEPLRALRDVIMLELGRQPAGKLPRAASNAQVASAVREAVDGQLRLAAFATPSGTQHSALHQETVASIVSHFQLLFDVPALAGCSAFPCAQSGEREQLVSFVTPC